MKVIELLNKIANGEKPIPIKYQFQNDITYYLYDKCREEYDDSNLQNILNEEVEIIEEDKKIEKIEKIEQRTDTGLIGTDSVDMIEHTNRINRQAGYLSEIVSKINEIIDRLEKE